MAEKVKGISIILEMDTTGLKKALSDIQGESSRVQKELRDVEKLLKMDPGNVELVAQKETLLARQVELTTEKLNALKAAQGQVEQEFQNGKIGEEQYRAFQRELVDTESKLKSYKSALSGVAPDQERLATNTERLKTYFAATKTSVDDYSNVLGTKMTSAIKNGTATSDQLELALNKIGKEALGSKTDMTEFKKSLDNVDGKSLDDVRGSLEKLDTESKTAKESIGDIGKKIDANTLMQASDQIQNAGQKITDFGTSSMEAFRSYDEGIDTIIKKTGAHGESIDQFEGIYKNLVDTVAVTDPYGKASDAIAGLSQQFGLTGQALEDDSALFMKFSEVTGMEVSTGVKDAEQAMSTFNMTSDQLPDILDAVNSASQRTGASADSIFESCIKGSQTLQDLGLDFQESANLMGVFEQAGVDSSAAVTQLSKANANWAKDGKTMKDGLSELQTYLKSDASDTDKLKAVTETFGTKGAEKIRMLAESGALDLGSLADSYDGVSGSINQTYDDITGADEKWDLAKQNFLTAMAQIGGAIMQNLLPYIQKAAGFVAGLADGFTKLPGPVQTAIIVAGGILALLAVLMPLIVSLSIVLPLIATGAGTVMAVIGSSLAIFNPMTLIIIAIVAAIIGVIAVIQHWGEITQWMSGVQQTVWNALPGPVQGALTAVAGIVQGGATAIHGFFTGDTSEMVAGLEQIYNSLPGPVQGAIQNMGNVMQGTQQTIHGLMTGDTQEMTSGMVQIYNALPGPVQSAIQSMGGGINSALGWIQGIIEGFKNTVNSIGDKFWEVAGNVQGAWNTIRGVLSGDLPFPHIPLPHLSVWGGFSLNPPSVPSFGIDWYAQGAVLTKPTIFASNGGSLMGGGEAGPEAVAPISTLQRYIKEAVSNENGGGDTYNLYIDGIRYNDGDAMDSRITNFVDAIIMKGAMFNGSN